MEPAPMILLGLDPATKTGWASYEDLGRGKPPRVRCGSIVPKDYRADEITEAQVFARFAQGLREMIDEVKPRRVALEMRLPSIVAGAIEDDPGALIPGTMRARPITDDRAMKRKDGIRGIILAMLGMSRPSIGLPNGIPYHEVRSQEWRAALFGKGVAPPKTKLVAGEGVKKLSNDERRKWWKHETRMKVELLAERWGFRVPNQDAADAVGVVLWLATREGHFSAIEALRRAA